ncbi:MAG: O-antigen ligase family protein, partial [Candidatus Magasanikbacteria bacterium]|nr:O-antigen ligase family protein [Candidatus Magasanikbacteria bacterium]
TYFPWNFGKTIIFQIVVELLLFLHIIGQAMKSDDKTAKPMNWLDWSLIIFLLVITITAFTGVNVSNSFWGNQARANGIFTWLHFGIWYFLLSRYFSEKKDWVTLLSLTAGAAIIVSGTIFFQHSLPAAWQSEAGGGIIGNRAFAAAYLLVAFGLALVLTFYLSGKRRWWSLAGALVLLIALFWTGNRGAILGLFTGGFTGLAAAVFMVKDKKNRRLSIVALSLGILASGVLTAMAITKKLSVYLPRLAAVINIDSLTSGTGETRLMAWQIAWQGIKERPILGWGWGNYDITFNKYFNPHFLKYNFTETVWDKPHNWLLEIGVISGVFGLVSYLSIFGIASYYLIRKKGEQVSFVSPIISSILLGMLAGYLATSLFLFETSDILLLFFLLLAFISVEYAPRQVVTLHPRWLAVRRFFWVPYTLFILISLYYFNYLPLKASYYLSQARAAADGSAWSLAAARAVAVPAPFVGETAIFLAERFIQLDKAGADITAKETASVALQVADALEKQSDRYRDNPLFPVWAGQVYMALGEKVDPKYYINAEPLLLRAHGLSPQKQEFLFFLGRLYLLEKDFPRAIDVQKQAVAADPSISTSYWFLGLTYIASDDVATGLSEIETALKQGYALTLDQRLYLLDIYAGEKKYDKVIEGYRHLIKDFPDNVNWYIRLATAYALARDKASALQTTETAVSLYPPLRAEADAFIKQYKLK